MYYNETREAEFVNVESNEVFIFRWEKGEERFLLSVAQEFAENSQISFDYVDLLKLAYVIMSDIAIQSDSEKHSQIAATKKEIAEFLRNSWEF